MHLLEAVSVCVLLPWRLGWSLDCIWPGLREVASSCFHTRTRTALLPPQEVHRRSARRGRPRRSRRQSGSSPGHASISASERARTCATQSQLLCAVRDGRQVVCAVLHRTTLLNQYCLGLLCHPCRRGAKAVAAGKLRDESSGEEGGTDEEDMLPAPKPSTRRLASPAAARPAANPPGASAGGEEDDDPMAQVDDAAGLGAAASAKPSSWCGNGGSVRFCCSLVQWLLLTAARVLMAPLCRATLRVPAWAGHLLQPCPAGAAAAPQHGSSRGSGPRARCVQTRRMRNHRGRRKVAAHPGRWQATGVYLGRFGAALCKACASMRREWQRLGRQCAPPPWNTWQGPARLLPPLQAGGRRQAGGGWKEARSWQQGGGAEGEVNPRLSLGRAQAQEQERACMRVRPSAASAGSTPTQDVHCCTASPPSLPLPLASHTHAQRPCGSTLYSRLWSACIAMPTLDSLTSHYCLCFCSFLGTVKLRALT